MPTAVQRIGVNYNTAAAGMTDELTLLNIVRAKDSFPLHYTTIGRLTGSLTVKASGGLNVQLRESADTDLRSTTTTGTGLSDVVSRTVVSGGDVLTPNVGAEVNTGPSFDISVLDTQEFYNGILASIPFSVINNFLLQGYDSSYLMGLLAERIDLRLKDKVPGISENKGELLLSLRNSGLEADTSNFARVISCFILSSEEAKLPNTPLAPLSRVTRDRGEPRQLTMKDLTLLDGKALDLSEAIPLNPQLDSNVIITRPGAKIQVAKLTKSKSCDEPTRPVNGRPVTAPETPPAERIYVGAGQIMILGPDGKSGIVVDADMSVTFRSPEGVIQFVGRCLERSRSGHTMHCSVGSNELFTLEEGLAPNALVSTRLHGRSYFIPDNDYGKKSMAVISLIERLLNLQKKSSDKPVTIPVQVVP